MLLTSLALALTVQAGAETAIAIRNDDPETWVVEYPRVIRPFVVQYRQCLNVSDRWVRGKADFEEQHRTDIPRCAKEREKAITASNAAMEGSKTRIGPEEINTLFDNIGLIHIARGRDLDDQFKQRVAASAAATEQYEKDKPKGLVLELVDGSVVKSRAEIEAAEAATTPNKVTN